MKELHSLEDLHQHLQQDPSLDNVALQNIDLRQLKAELLARLSFRGALLLGCNLSPEQSCRATEEGALVFPRLTNLPYEPYRAALYTVDELYQGYVPSDPTTDDRYFDQRIYQHWRRSGGAHPPSIMESLGRRLHDHAISDALEEFLQTDDHAGHMVAIMGGHAMSRQAPSYRQVAELTRELSQHGYTVASGGGPGAMEAAHLGCFLSNLPDTALADALSILSEAPSYKDAAWLRSAFAVRERFHHPPADQTAQSLSIPTWYYGHEPPNVFASHIAKYFANSVREDGLLSLARHGVVFFPGSAGTIQEIFQDACQNHYESLGHASPMIFFGTQYWNQEKPVYPLLKSLAQGQAYDRWLSITDDIHEVIATLGEFRKSLA